MCLPPGQHRPTLGAATLLRPTEDPRWWVPPWGDQGLRTLEVADLPWAEEVLSSQGRQGVLQLVEEALCRPDQATGGNISVLCLHVVTQSAEFVIC